MLSNRRGLHAKDRGTLDVPIQTTSKLKNERQRLLSIFRFTKGSPTLPAPRQVFLRVCAIACFAVAALAASEYRGEVTFNTMPVPGATVSATRDSRHFETVTDQQGFYSF